MFFFLSREDGREDDDDEKKEEKKEREKRAQTSAGTGPLYSSVGKGVWAGRTGLIDQMF